MSFTDPFSVAPVPVTLVAADVVALGVAVMVNAVVGIATVLVPEVVVQLPGVMIAVRSDATVPERVPL